MLQHGHAQLVVDDGARYAHDEEPQGIEAALPLLQVPDDAVEGILKEGILASSDSLGEAEKASPNVTAALPPVGEDALEVGGGR